MKRILYSVLLILLFASLGYAAAPETSQNWRKGSYGLGDGAVLSDPRAASTSASAQNVKIYIEGVWALCKRGEINAGNNATTAPCVFAIRHYSTVATGSVMAGQMYPLSVSGGTEYIPVGEWSNVGGVSRRYHRPDDAQV